MAGLPPRRPRVSELGPGQDAAAGLPALSPVADRGSYVNIAEYVSSRYGQGRMALVSSLEDDDIRQHYELEAGAYAVALQSLAGFLTPLPNWRHFFIPGSTHTMNPFNLEETTVCGLGVTSLVGQPCAPSLATFLNEEVNYDAGWASADPQDGAPGTAYDAGYLSACSIAH